MNDAVSKTKALERRDLPIDWLEANTANPNQMSDAEFNMLSDNLERTGFTDPILVRRIGENKYRIVGGHHRWEVAKLQGFEQVPCTIIDDPDFDDDQEKFQVVRMNVIRGKMSPDKFMALYQSMDKKYEAEVMQEAFGFVDEEQFKKLTKQMSTALPKELQADFEKAAKEIKTIDGLSKLLNGMFNKFGDTIPYGYMFLDYGGKESVWLRCSNETRKAVSHLGKRCIENQRSMDDIIGGLIRMAAAGKFDKELVQLIANSDPVQIPEGFDKEPTLENLSHG